MIYVTHDQTEAMTMGERIVIMKDGIVNQVDTPLNLYNKPANRFVAGFIGSPSMNFIKGSLENGKSIKFRSSGNDLILEMKQNLNHQINKYVNKEVWLGIRPEDIYDPFSAGRDDLDKKEVVLDVVEPMGNEIFLYFQLDNMQFVARIPAREEPPAGSKRSLMFDTNKLHFFDAETETSIR
jgi:multiple sugar transport system ATP-binding protein